jgi:hypothetical protein
MWGVAEGISLAPGCGALEGFGLGAVAGFGGKKSGRFTLKLLVLLLNDGAFEEFVYSLAGGPVTFCGFDVIVHVGFDRVTLGEFGVGGLRKNCHGKPRLIHTRLHHTKLHSGIRRG